MAKKSTMDLLRGYTDGANNTSGKKFYVSTVSGSANQVTVTRFGKMFNAASDKITKVLSYTPARSYGAFLLSFGVFALVIHFILGYIGVTESIPTYVIIISAALALLGTPFVLTGKPMAILFQDMELTDFIFFEFFCIRRMHRSDKEKGLHYAVGIVLGALFGVLSIFVPIWMLVSLIGIMIYLFLTFLSPEFSFFSIFLVMPYLTFDTDGVLLAIMVAVTVISYMRKVALGKRVYSFEQYDLMLIVMLACILISGIFVKGVESFVSSVVMILLGMGYILSSSLVTNRRLADCLINAVIISSLPISVIAITESALDISRNGIEAFTGATATFDKPYTLAVFLLVSCVFSLYFVSSGRERYKRILYALVSLVTLFALACTMNLWAFMAALFGALAFVAVRMRHGSGVLLFVITFAVYALLFVPQHYLEIILDNELIKSLGFAEPITHWFSSFAMLKDNLLLGVGIGRECFLEEIANYAPTHYFYNSGNFLLELACEAGIISLAAFVIIFLIRIRHRGIYQPYIRNSQVSKLASFTSVCMVCLMVFGVFNYIWADMTMYYLFWCVFGLESAALRVSKYEFDERAAYFNDGSAEDSSSIDISIR